MSLRTSKTEQAYTAAKAAGNLIPLIQEPKIDEAPEFDYWKVVPNRFPHDQHHKLNLLIALKRDCAIEDVSLDELAELWYRVFAWADTLYDFIKFNLKAMRSVNGTPHLHIMVLKKRYK